VAYSYPLRVKQPGDDQSFGYARFQDQMTGFFISDGSDGKDSIAVWTAWREAAVSCGAFPFAFRVKQLHRLQNEYPPYHLDPWQVPAQDFAYTDGGIFQNEPLGLAKNLVDLIDRPAQGPASSYQNADSRFYLYVAPGAKTSDANRTFTADAAQFLPTAQTIVKAVLHQARFQDWVNAEKVNDQINVFNLRAEQLYDALKSGYVDAAVLQHAADALLPGLFQTEPPPVPGVRDETPDDARARLRQQFKNESTELLKIAPGTTICGTGGCSASYVSGRDRNGSCMGEQLANMIQPFWALPVLAIAGISLRQVMGFTVMSFSVGAIVFGLTLLVLV
jgi:hypothetical protein